MKERIRKNKRYDERVEKAEGGGETCTGDKRRSRGIIRRRGGVVAAGGSV